MSASYETITKDQLVSLCDKLAHADPDLQRIITTYGYPPFWDRPNNYETLVHIILEQQVSLASARAALEKLRETVGQIVPENVTGLTDEAFRAAYFSRQKTGYVRFLTEQVLAGRLDIVALEGLSGDDIRSRLTQLKGIGNWTVDVYLILVLHRSDFFPLGDIAAVNALKQLKGLPKDTPPERLTEIVQVWKPYRTVGTMLLWRYYLSSRGKNLEI